MRKLILAIFFLKNEIIIIIVMVTLVQCDDDPFTSSTHANCHICFCCFAQLET